MRNRPLGMGISMAMAMGLMVPIDARTIVVREAQAEPKRPPKTVAAIEPEPQSEPHRAGKREAARRLRQLAKRKA